MCAGASSNPLIVSQVMAGSNEEDDEPTPKWMIYDSPERVCVCAFVP